MNSGIELTESKRQIITDKYGNTQDLSTTPVSNSSENLLPSFTNSWTPYIEKAAQGKLTKNDIKEFESVLRTYRQVLAVLYSTQLFAFFRGEQFPGLNSLRRY